MSPPAATPTTRGDVAISIGPDGRLYLHDLDAELIEVALALNPDDASMRRRRELSRSAAQAGPPRACAAGRPAVEEGRP